MLCFSLLSIKNIYSFARISTFTYTVHNLKLRGEILFWFLDSKLYLVTECTLIVLNCDARTDSLF